jgi:hypothetical protein
MEATQSEAAAIVLASANYASLVNFPLRPQELAVYILIGRDLHECTFGYLSDHVFTC